MKYALEKHIPMPTGRQLTYGEMNELRETFNSMEVGDSFIYDGIPQYPYVAAKLVGVRIKTQKQKNGTLRVWLTSK